MKHEGDIPVTNKCKVVSSGDILAIRMKIIGSACVSACVIGQLSAPIGYLYHLVIWKTRSIQ